MIPLAQRDSLPTETGVYFFYGQRGELLYIGKAKNIRARVQSHFRDPQKQWLGQVEEIDFLLLPSEEDALLSERELIASRQPRYNIRLRDDKSYPRIAVSLDEEFPRVFITREDTVPGRVYFGPWGEAKRARDLMAVLPEIYPFRSCSGAEPGRASGSPCLDYHMGLCEAPCAELVSPEEYRQGIDKIITFLSGKRREVAERVEREMNQLSREKRYEEAARKRDRLLAIRSLSPRKGGWGADRDIAGAHREGEDVCVCVLEIREGIIAEQKIFFVQSPDLSLAEIEEDFAPSSQGGDELPRLARKNARLALLREKSRESGSLHIAEALADLQECLGSRHPWRIEGYDVANIGGEHTVGSMVVFEGGRRRRDHYRTFRIDRDNPDDYASLRDMLQRRSRRATEDISPYDSRWDESFSSLPDVILVDGGEGQLSSALAAAEPLLERGCTIISLAKREERVYGVDGEIDLPRPARELLQRVRDEAHRTSNARHRSLRGRSAIHSPLDDIPGIGSKRKAALLGKWGSLDAIRSSSPEELAKTPGISLPLAEIILREL